ncbi:MAG: PaaI family thioesterase [Lentisphaerae bacterium]|nr:PaaI family thioesterase [Lentisphaerota bacterium]
MNIIEDNEKYSEIFGHNNCLLCGENNRHNLGLKFKLLGDGRVHTKFKAFEVLQGYEGLLHGGVTYGLLASAMVHCLFHNGIKAVTADANIRFFESVPCTAEIDLFGEIVEKKRSLYYMKGEIIYKGKLMAKATARFMKKTN